MRRPRIARLFRCVRRLVARLAHGPRTRTSRVWAHAREQQQQPAAPRLPPEVLEHVLGFLRGDRHALAACALTCRAFLPVVRQLVFRKIHLAQRLGPDEYTRFVVLLQHSPHVALSVRDLTISIDSRLDHPTLPPILPRLHEVENLTLDFAGGTFEMDENTRDKLPTYFRMVKRLRLENVRFDGTDLLQILCACPELSDLQLCAVRWRRSSLLPTYTADLAAVVPPHPVELTGLVLRSPPPQVVAWLAKGSFSLRTQTLELFWDGSSDAKYVPSLFQGAGESLRHLTLAFPSWFSHKNIMDLSHNTHLSTVHFDKIRIDGSQPRYVYVPDPVQLRTYEWVPAALAGTHSLHLQQVHFSIELCMGGDITVLDWAAIDASLERLAHEAGGLATTFHVENSDYAPARYDVIGAIMYRLPRLRNATGRLGVVYTHWPKVEECWFP